MQVLLLLPFARARLQEVREAREWRVPLPVPVTFADADAGPQTTPDRGYHTYRPSGLTCTYGPQWFEVWTVDGVRPPPDPRDDD
jgi:hypothetical protein